MSDVVERAKAALEGVTPGPWEHRTAPHEADDSSAAHEEWLAGTLIRSGEPLHVLIAESNQPQFAYIVPAVTGDGPTSATNADFVAAARSLVPELVAEIERLRAAETVPNLDHTHVHRVWRDREGDTWRYNPDVGWCWSRRKTVVDEPAVPDPADGPYTAVGDGSGQK